MSLSAGAPTQDQADRVLAWCVEHGLIASGSKPDTKRITQFGRDVWLMLIGCIPPTEVAYTASEHIKYFHDKEG